MDSLTHESLRAIAMTLPQPMRDAYFQKRKAIRAELAEKRWREYREPTPHGRPKSLYDLVPWEDPEYVALCLFYLNGELQKMQDAVNRLAGR